MSTSDELFELLQGQKRMYQALMAMNRQTWDMLHAQFDDNEEFQKWYDVKCSEGGLAL